MKDIDQKKTKGFARKRKQKLFAQNKRFQDKRRKKRNKYDVKKESAPNGRNLPNRIEGASEVYAVPEHQCVGCAPPLSQDQACLCPTVSIPVTQLYHHRY